MMRFPCPRIGLVCAFSGAATAWAAAATAAALVPTGAGNPSPVAATVAGPAIAATSDGAKPVRARATDEIHGLLNLGASLTDRGDFEAAEIALRQVLNASEVALPEIKTALLGLARMHRKQGAVTKAVAIYERYLKDYPGDDRAPDALLELGRGLRTLGIYKSAIARFYSVLNATLKLPGDGFERYQVLAKTAQFEIAQTHFEAGEYAEAGRFFARLRLLDLAPPDRARAHFMAAYSQRLQGDLDVAVTTLRAFIEQSPDDENVAEGRYLLAVTLRELKRPQEALTAALELLRTEKSRQRGDPKRWAYWQRRTGNQLANDFFETGDTLHAHAIYVSLVELSPEPAWRLPLTYQIALCHERLGMVERARSAYQTIVDGATSPDLAELGRMAAWRLEHLAWRERANKQIAELFLNGTAQQHALAAPASSAGRLGPGSLPPPVAARAASIP
jgi:tetratricopeptide (TPR) repeat protein